MNQLLSERKLNMFKPDPYKKGDLVECRDSKRIYCIEKVLENQPDLDWPIYILSVLNPELYRSDSRKDRIDAVHINMIYRRVEL